MDYSSTNTTKPFAGSMPSTYNSATIHSPDGQTGNPNNWVLALLGAWLETCSTRLQPQTHRLTGPERTNSDSLESDTLRI